MTIRIETKIVSRNGDDTLEELISAVSAESGKVTVTAGSDRDGKPNTRVVVDDETAMLTKAAVQEALDDAAANAESQNRAKGLAPDARNPGSPEDQLTAAERLRRYLDDGNRLGKFIMFVIQLSQRLAQDFPV